MKQQKILFLYADNRARYLINALKNEIDLMNIFKVQISWKNLFFWINLLSCILKIKSLNRHRLNVELSRQPKFIKEISSKIEKHIDSMMVKPDLIVQWMSMFAPYTETPKIPFALIIDNYTDPPNSLIQKDKLRGWTSEINQKRFYEFQKKLYSNAKYIFTFSKWCRKGLIDEYEINPKKVFPIGWGPAKKINSKKSFRKIPKTILAVGNCYPAKGFDILLNSARLLKDFKITIVGKDKTFKDFKIPKNVRIRGYVSDETLINLYSKSEFFFIFSRFEPAGHVLWEAQATGCVVIGYVAYGISEAVINNKTGILLKTRNPILLAEEIRRLYQNEKRLKHMQKAAIENYLKNGSWDVVSSKIAKILDDS